MYEMVLGGWADTHSTLRVGTQGTNQALVSDSNGWLDSRDFTWFWASAKEGHLKLGKGKVVGVAEITSWQDPNRIDVKYVGFSTGWTYCQQSGGKVELVPRRTAFMPIHGFFFVVRA
jgi:hypothetical protein